MMIGRKTIRFSKWANMPEEEFKKLPPAIVASISYRLMMHEKFIPYCNYASYSRKKENMYKIWKQIENWKKHATEEELNIYEDLLKQYNKGTQNE